jgi:hypothetical protein
MRNAHVLVFLLCFFIKNLGAQKVNKITLMPQENLHNGVFGWIYSETDRQIKVYAYSHKVVDLLELPREQYNKLYDALKSDKKGKQVWEGIKAVNSLGPATLLVIEEHSYDTALKSVGYRSVEYHTSQLKGDYFRGSLVNNSSDPNNKGREEVLYNKGVNDIYTDFPLLKKCMQVNV